jgi:hypothetical protein
VHVSDPNDDSIPVLHEILVPGHPAGTRPSSSGAAVTQPSHEADVPREPSFKAGPVLAPHPVHEDEPARAPEPALAAQPVLTPEHTLAPPPVLSTHDEPASLSAGVFDRAEPATPIEAGTIVPPDLIHDAHETPTPPPLDADLIAERLRGRFAGFLTGEGRGIVEARCREALQEHSTWLVGQITREVALTLETEMAGWVKEAVEQALKEETARRSHGV